MLLFDGAFGVLMFGLWLFCIIDVITTPASVVRNLPKLAWIFIVLLLPALGSIGWLLAGRSWNPAARQLARQAAPGEPTRPGRADRAGQRTRSRPTNPDDDEDFLAGLKARAEEQRRRAHDARDDEQRPDTTD